jgi:hypothetical protein
MLPRQQGKRTDKQLAATDFRRFLTETHLKERTARNWQSLATRPSGISSGSHQISGMTRPAPGGTITGMDKAAITMRVYSTILATVAELDAPDDVLALAMIGAGIMVLARVDPVTAERLAAAIENHTAH